MDLHEFQKYHDYFYRVSVNSSPAGEWHGTIDVCRYQSDGTIESLISQMDAPGTFVSKGLARDACAAYCRMLIDEQKIVDK
ncbi:conserved protein of unknown function [Burkholderia multivorans]